MKILDFVLKGKWFDMIASGEKPEEYREFKPYWIIRLCDNPVFNAANGTLIGRKPISYWTVGECNRIGIDLAQAFHRGNMIPKDFTHVRFRRAYTNITMTFEFGSISMGKGKSKWGAPDSDCFIIKFGKRINTRD